MSEAQDLVSGLTPPNPLDQWAGRAPPLAVSPDLSAPAAKPTQQAPSAAQPKPPDTVVAPQQNGVGVGDDPLAPVMAKISGGESGGNDPYHETYGGGHFGWQGIPNTGSGKYGFVKSTWDRAASQWTAQHPGSPPPEFNNPKDQDEIARYWAQKRYHDKTGRDLKTDAAVGKVDYSALESEWPSLAPNHAMHVGWADEDRAKHQESMSSATAMQSEFMRLANEETPGSKQREELLFKAREAADRASESFEQLRKTPPYYRPADVAENFGSAAVLIAAIGGLFARRPMTASLGAMGQAMQAQNQQKWDQFKAATDQWKTQADMGLAQSKLAHDQIREVMEDEKLAFNEKEAKITRLLSAWQMGETAKWHDETFRAQRMDAWQRANEHAEDMKQRWQMHVDTMQGAVGEKKLEQELFQDLTAARETGDPAKIDAAQQKVDDFRRVRSTGGAASGKLGGGKQFEITGPDGKVTPVYAREMPDGKLFDVATQKPLDIPPGSQVRAVHEASAGGGRGGVQTQRQIISGREILSDLQNVVSLPTETTAGAFGGRKQGPGLMDALKEDFAQSVTDQDAQLYTSALAGFQRELSIVVSPVYGGNYASEMFQGLGLKEGMTVLTKAYNIARIKQTADNALEGIANTGWVDKETKAYANDIRKRLDETVPWTPADVMAFRAQGDNRETFSQWVQNKGVSGAGGSVSGAAAKHTATGPNGEKIHSDDGVSWLKEDGTPYK